MIEFFNHYILPSSPARSKLAIHLNAQTQASGKEAADEDEEAVPVKAEGNGTIPFVITDIRELRSKMQISAGPQPVKHISKFEEPDSKS